MHVRRRTSAHAGAARSERSSGRRAPWTGRSGGTLVAVLVSAALLFAVAGCGTDDGSGDPGSASGPPTAVESPVPVTTAQPSPSPSPTTDASAPDPSGAEPDGSYEERARYWVERQEAWRKKAVAAVAATDHPGGDIWEAMREPMVIPEDEMPDDPDAPAWRDLAALAKEYAAWWERVVGDPTLPFSQ